MRRLGFPTSHTEDDVIEVPDLKMGIIGQLVDNGPTAPAHPDYQRMEELATAAKAFLDLCTPDGYPTYESAVIEMWFGEQHSPAFWQAFKRLKAALDG